ncbi:MAG: TrbG/VirB9 family P-type conjugative transfer protein, partial [Xanthomonas perforans]|nr:TrbG/VirB9 family P-type conjugative transfer protein [Xanthomonas perforans]
DGRFTYLRFPNNRDFPTVFLVAGDKSESIVNANVDPSAPDILVVHRVAREMVLRLGSAVVGIYNDSYNMDGVPTNTGTTVPGVERVIKSGEVK